LPDNGDAVPDLGGLRHHKWHSAPIDQQSWPSLGPRLQSQIDLGRGEGEEQGYVRFQFSRRMTFVGLVPASVIGQEVSWSKPSSSWATCPCKRPSDTSDANSDSTTRSTIGSDLNRICRDLHRFHLTRRLLRGPISGSVNRRWRGDDVHRHNTYVRYIHDVLAIVG
jgi:hypothetical protein